MDILTDTKVSKNEFQVLPVLYDQYMTIKEHALSFSNVSISKR